jgi:hypothetical protein
VRLSSVSPPRRYAALGVIAAFAALIIGLDGLQFAPIKDETHFWPNALQFSQSWIPNLELLRDYGELNTPLPFIVFGWLEKAFGGGIPAARLLNALVGIAIACALVLLGRERDREAILSTLGLMLCPYFFGCSLLLYTDIIACGFVMLGCWFYLRERHLASAIALVFAIASRQYMVAVPAAIAGYELLRALRSRELLRIEWLAPALAASTIFGWLWFFGGPGPPGEVERQGIVTASAWRVLPDHGLYMLACVGLYFVPLELLFFWRIARPRVAPWPVCLAIALVLLVLFALFPPIGNIAYSTDRMGLFDRIVRDVVGSNDFLRVSIFYLAALAACVRFSRYSLPMLVVVVNALLFTKSQIIWDKYTLPLLLVLWLLSANGSYFDADSWRVRVRERNTAGG